MIFKNSAGHRIEVTHDNVVRFCAQGGGFMQQMPLQTFLSEYALEDAPPAYRKALFFIENGASIEGYHNGERWNGWAKPVFSQWAIPRIAEQMGDMVVNSSGDVWEWAPDEGGNPEEVESWQKISIEVDGETIDGFTIGAGSWCWDVEEIQP